jgi:hypothetical protein
MPGLTVMERGSSCSAHGQQPIGLEHTARRSQQGHGAVCSQVLCETRGGRGPHVVLMCMRTAGRWLDASLAPGDQPWHASVRLETLIGSERNAREPSISLGLKRLGMASQADLTDCAPLRLSGPPSWPCLGTSGAYLPGA